MTFLTVWIVYAICGSVIFSAVFVWAVRARQFSDLDRARYIALRTSDDIDPAGKPPGRVDRWTLPVIVVIALAPLAIALWIGLGKG